ncbi:MAG: hypothetical protein IPL96_10025 [Holophagaceae bacterium]|nr:hypothetical protein [Holophagaceae bacterium]
MKLRFATAFLRTALEQEAPVRKGLGKLLRLAESLSLAELLNHQCVHLEKLVGHSDPTTGQPLYSLRITAGARAIALLDGDSLVLLRMEADHGKAYR